MSPSSSLLSLYMAILTSDESTEKSLLDVRTKALNLKKDYAAKVKLRADSQREVNDLLQRKGSWSSADVLRYAIDALPLAFFVTQADRLVE